MRTNDASLLHRLRRTLSADIGVRPGDAVLIAVSGGPDSMALLHLLAELRPMFPLRLFAACIDHGLRPAETPAEWETVRAACGRLGIPAERIAVDARAEAESQKISLEHAARNVRYRALEARQRELGADWLALAHTADDQAEELLLRLLRGGSRRALAGMRLKSGDRIRPLLGVGKAELLAWLEGRGIAYCHDSSNDDPRFLRNRIRLHLLPLLEREYDAGARRALLKCADNLAEDEALLDELVQAAWQKAVTVADDAAGQPAWRLDLAAFRPLHPALKRRLLERLLYTAGDAAGHEHILALLRLADSAEPGKELHLPQGLRALRERKAVIFCCPWGHGPTRQSCKAKRPENAKTAPE